MSDLADAAMGPELIAFPPPWDAGWTAIFDFLRDRIGPDTQGLPKEAWRLPDEARFNPRGAPGWISNAYAAHAGSRDEDLAGQVLSALKLACREPSSVHVGRLYSMLVDDRVFQLVDPLLARLAGDEGIPKPRLGAFARWLATTSPDRGPVKLGIALLGLSRDGRDAGIVSLLGRHFEFTLFATVALGRILPEDACDAAWWDLARHHDGWGRIHLVRRLSLTRNPAIKRWLLRDGFRNRVMNEYLAHPCAVGGDLLEALRADEVEETLLRGAGAIIDALIRGGPAKDMRDYADGAAAVRRYLEHMALREPADLRDFLIFLAITRHVADERWRGEHVRHPWSESEAREIVLAARRLVSAPGWSDLVRRDLATDSERVFAVAAIAAGGVGFDSWEHRFERLRSRGSEQWHDLMQTDDPERIDRVVALALDRLDLGAMVTGPPRSRRLGTQNRQDDVLGFLLQELRRFPGKGWPLVAAGLRSPVVANRNYALRLLDAWGRERWPPEADGALRAALALEPDDHRRENIGHVLEGRQIVSRRAKAGLR